MKKYSESIKNSKYKMYFVCPDDHIWENDTGIVLNNESYFLCPECNQEMGIFRLRKDCEYSETDLLVEAHKFFNKGYW
jgi:hypothetical protein